MEAVLRYSAIAGDLDESIDYSPISGHANQSKDGLRCVRAQSGATTIFGGRYSATPLFRASEPWR